VGQIEEKCVITILSSRHIICFNRQRRVI